MPAIRAWAAQSLKVLPADVVNDAGRRLRFEGEARSASALNHPESSRYTTWGKKAALSTW